MRSLFASTLLLSSVLTACLDDSTREDQSGLDQCPEFVGDCIAGEGPIDSDNDGCIDGCGPVSTFFHVVLPNSLSSIFAVGILQFLFCWNSLLIPLLFLRTNVPLPVVFAQIAGTYDANWDMQSVAAIVTTIVPLVIFLVFQRQFAGGALTNSGSKE